MHPLVRTMLAACVALLCADAPRSMAQRPFDGERAIWAGLGGYPSGRVCKWQRREVRLLVLVPDDEVFATRRLFEARATDRASLESASGLILHIDVAGPVAAAGASHDVIYDGAFGEAGFFLGQRRRALAERLVERDRELEEPPTHRLVFTSRRGALERIVLRGNRPSAHDGGVTAILAAAFGLPRFYNKRLGDYRVADHMVILRTTLERLYARPDACPAVSDLFDTKALRDP